MLYFSCFANGDLNDLSAFIPEQWAQEGLAILEENMVACNLVHRDFSPALAKFGDVVNTRKPTAFKTSRKADGTTLVQEDAIATNVPVTLNQWFYKSFVIRDGEGSMSFQDLKDIYLTPAMQSIARGVDRSILGRVPSYLNIPTKRVGKLQGMTSSTAKNDVLAAREILNVNKCPMDGRRLVMAPTAETAMLQTELFIKANERGDGGSALTSATLGRILGFDTYMDQNVNSVISGCDVAAGPYTLTEAYAAGEAGSLACASISTDAVNGEFAVVTGNEQPTWILTHTDSTTIELNEALKNATLDNAPVTVYKACTMASVTDYVAGYSKQLTVAAHTSAKPPQVGQVIAFGVTLATRHTYTIIETEYVSGTSTKILLDRPLEIAVLTGASAFPGPMGSMNMAFHRDAIAFVSRPLALPSAGVQSGVANYNGIGMRVCMQYSIQAGGTIVNCDILAGVAVLDTALCCVVLG